VHVKRLRGERGSIIVIAAVILPLFLLICALVVDSGDWFTHKRQLQNRADAGALAAGVEYLSQLANCQTNPGGAGAAIADAAKRYAGDPDASVPGTKYNQEITNDNSIVVAINRTNVTDASDDSDGGNPCERHPTGDGISPNVNSIWTDVKVRESNIGTLFRSFGINLPSVTARARVQVKQITGLGKGGLPFVHETGDYVDCVWAEFVDVSTGNRVSLVGSSNPVLLTADPKVPRRWTADVNGINLPGAGTAVGVNYWMGSATNGTCDFSTTLKRQLPGDKDGNPTPIDWINVFDDVSAKSGAPPRLHHFSLIPGNCGSDRVGFIYASSATPTCGIGFTAEVERGSNPAPNSITVTSSNGWCTTNCVSSAPGTPSGSSGTTTTYSGQITYNPHAVSGSTSISQDYTQVGLQQITATWTMTSGTLTSGTIDDGSKNGKTCTTGKPCVCTTGSPCIGDFETNIPGNVVHATYIADPVNSSPIYSAELLSGSTPMPNSIAADGGPTGPFTVVLVNNGVDKDHIVLIRDSVQASGNRTMAIDCGQGNGASKLDAAIQNGCPKKMAVNQRGDSCSPAPPLPNGTWDCINDVSGNKKGPVASGLTLRFASPCTPNYWSNSSPGDLLPSDPRFAYIFLTSYGQLTTKHGWYPIKAFLRVYVTGGDGMNCPGDDKPPRGYDGKGSQVWGHLVDFVTLSDDVIVGDPECNTDVAIVNCKPELVR
jgi:Putative Flp pilus-assembly TadE/G-like